MDDRTVEALRILLLEDTLSDAELEENELRDAGLVFTLLRVDTRAAFEQALDEFNPGIVIADYRLPGYNGREALEYSRRMHPQIPVIMVTGALGDEAAVELLRLGARDYVLKGSLARLAPAIQRALSEERGIRNRKLAEAAVHESETRYRRLFEAAKDGILILDAETGVIVDANPFILKLLSYSRSECVGKMLWEIGLFADTESSKVAFKELQSQGHIRYEDLPLETKDGQRRDVEFISNAYEVDGRKVIQCNIRDITERRLMEQALRDGEARYKRITEGLTDYQYTVHVENGRAVETRQSPACVTVTGYQAEEFSANPYLWIQMVVPEDRELVGERVKQVLAGKDVPPMEHRIIRKDGELRWVHDTTILFKDASGKLLSYDGVIKDITERKESDAGLKLFRALLDQSNDAIEVSDPETYRFIDVNETACRMLGYSRSELLSMRVQDVDLGIDDLRMKKIAEDLQAYGSSIIETRHRRKDGSTFPVEVSITSVRVDKEYGVAMVRDITERKLAEQALHRLNRTLMALSAGNHALVHAEDEKSLLENMCRATAEAGYVLAWVGYALQDEKKSIVPMAMFGEGKAYVEALHITWDDQPLGRGPTGTAVRTGQTQIANDISSNPGMVHWREAAAEYGYASVIALPLLGNGQVIGALTIYAAEPDAFGPDQVALLEEMASDLAFGIVTLRIRTEHEQHAAILRQSLEQSIQTIAGTVEARDPYTAGHQRRVSELATAIAREMGLPEEQVNGIHLAAIIHDLGKIHIPAEILAKPGKLTEIEFMLIKTHPQAGYNILKNVKFPWPIADIILQHHERLDGSGYPQGLKGGEILLEARIITVADVVEAMSSHRPYRPTLGNEAALQEIRRGRGNVYDAAIVDACLRLFAIKGFSFSSPSS
jgi:PAS domain S-box-containing protein/putative nucleotidyltransferase with HDIG domain